MKKGTYKKMELLARVYLLLVDEVEGGLLCLRGLETWEQAERIAAKNPNLHLEPTVIHRRASENFWHVVGRAYAPLEITAADYGENYEVYDKSDAELFKQNAMNSLCDFDSLKDVAEYAAKAAVTLEKIKELKPGQIVVAYCDEYIETTDRRTMFFSNDSNIWTIGLIAYND